VSGSLLIWVLVAPLLGAVAALFGKLHRPLERPLAIAAAASLAVPAVVLAVLAEPVASGARLVYSLGGWPEPYGIALLLDGVSWISAALTTAIAAAVVIFSLGNSRYGAGYYFFLLMMTVGMYGVALTGDLFTMFVCFEVIAVSVYVLIAYEGTATGLAASYKYLVLSTTGILFFLFGIFLVYRDLGVLSISAVSSALAEEGGVLDTHVMHLALASLCVGIGVRTAFIPFHTWLPEAHAYAPHPISAVLSGAMIKISFFAMVRIILELGGDYLMQLLMWIGAVTALVAVVSALAQTDVKRLLAYHSISQLGYILAVFGAGSALALTASFSHALNHALFKSLLFLTVGTAASYAGTRNVYRIPPLGRSLPVFSAAFFVGALSISGIPPFNGFASKALITAGMNGSPAYPLLWVTGFLTLASFVKLGRVFLPGARDARPPKGEYRPGVAETSVVSALALLCLATGVFGGPVAGWLHRLLHGGAPGEIPRLFSVGKLLGVAPLALLGAGAYAAVSTDPGKRLSVRIRAMAPGLRTVLLFFFVGLLAFAAVAY
jgi:multicomponent Na+:H+ antiporter subunit D